MKCKIFAHRGFGLPQNSVASLENARKNGFNAIEFDIWFLQQKLVLKHNRPAQSEIKTLPILRDYFRFADQFFYWMDFKNLNEKNCVAALTLAKSEIKKSGVKLSQIYIAPFITDYKKSAKILRIARKIFGEEVNFLAVCESLKNAREEKNLREFLTKNRVKFLSIFHELIDEKFLKNFADIEIFAWTVNEEKRLEQLARFGVANVASDKIIPSRHP
jgi:glycerophosphoryl diester phosphodiesterase